MWAEHSKRKAGFHLTEPPFGFNSQNYGERDLSELLLRQNDLRLPRFRHSWKHVRDSLMGVA